jgi:F-type H+-transporting ATPase subunit b
MHINWFTVIAQIVNFLILAWLLKKYLYLPILNAINEREQKIAGQLKNADEKNSEAEKEKVEFARRNEDFDKNVKALMDKAVADANKEKTKLLEQAKADAIELKAALQKAIDAEQTYRNKEIAGKIQAEVFAVARKALFEMASLSLEEQSVNIFIKHIKESNGDEKKRFCEAFQSNANTILVKSAFNISADQQTQVNNAVNEVLGTKTSLQFKMAPELISGIELLTNGYRLAWNFSDYLNSLENSIVQKIEQLPEKAA